MIALVLVALLVTFFVWRIRRRRKVAVDLAHARVDLLSNHARPPGRMRGSGLLAVGLVAYVALSCATVVSQHVHVAALTTCSAGSQWQGWQVQDLGVAVADPGTPPHGPTDASGAEVDYYVADPAAACDFDWHTATWNASAYDNGAGWVDENDCGGCPDSNDGTWSPDGTQHLYLALNAQGGYDYGSTVDYVPAAYQTFDPADAVGGALGTLGDTVASVGLVVGVTGAVLLALFLGWRFVRRSVH